MANNLSCLNLNNGNKIDVAFFFKFYMRYLAIIFEVCHFLKTSRNSFSSLRKHQKVYSIFFFY